LTPNTGSISPAMDYTIILVGVLARVDAGYLFLRCIRSPDSEEDRLHVNCWGTCPTLRLLLAVWHDCNRRSVMEPYRTFHLSSHRRFSPSSLVAMFCIYSTVCTFSYSIVIVISHPHANCHNDPSPLSVCFYRGIYQFTMSAVSVRGNKCVYGLWGGDFF